MSTFAQSIIILLALALFDLLIWAIFRRRLAGAFSPRLVWPTAGLLLATFSVFLTFFIKFGGTIEQQGIIIWLGLLICSIIAAALPTARCRKLAPAAILTAIIMVAELASAIFYPRYSQAGIASPQLRFMVAAPFAAILVAEVAACLTYLWRCPSGHGHLERLIAWRFLKAKKTAALSTVTFISIAGVTLGVALMIVSIGVLSGFERDMIDKMIGTNAHLTISAYNGYQIDDVAGKLDKIRNISGISAAYPYLMGEVMVASETNLAGAMLFGINGREAAKVVNVFDHIEMGTADFLDGVETSQGPKVTSPLPGINLTRTAPTKILVGIELLRILSADVGDTIRIVSPIHEELSPAGPIPKSRSFVIGGVFNTRMYEYDSKFIYIPLAAAQDFFDTDQNVSGIGIRLKNTMDTQLLAPKVLQAVGGYPLRIHDWKDKNEALLASVELEKIVTFVVLIFIVLVASFSIINTLTMSVMEKGQAIALLKAVGGNDSLLMKIFVYQGVFIGSFGTLAGALLGILLCQLVKFFGVWLDPEVYYIDQLPVYLEVGDVLLIVLSALAITFLAAVFPARLAERYNPVEGLRDG